MLLVSHVVKPLGMQASIFGACPTHTVVLRLFWILSQARINWEGCARKGIRRKNGGMAEMGHQLVWMGWQSIHTVGVSACVLFILQQKIQKMAICTFCTSSPGLSRTKSSEL